jgi:hypothetical protein
MLRLTGILIGSALAVGVLIFMLGVPQFAGPEPELAPEPIGATLVATEPDPAPVGATLVATEPDPEPTTELAPDTEALIGQIFSPDPAGARALAKEIATTPEPAPTDNWYAFWSPFRSELAANGFVSKLQETTGIDYRVVKVKTGVYEVAFAYTDDADVQDKLARISAATGLDMSGG